MSASTESSATDVEVGSENELPQLSALFLIKFDKKVGYTIAWKRSTIDVSLDGAVEFKSLPSGLHSVDSDLVYFVHEGYAGLSAFAKGEASAEERNANFVAVGILVSRSYGRLGRSWLLAGRLQKIAAALADDPDATTPLQEFWDAQSKAKDSSSSPSSSSQQEEHKKHSRARALSTITAVIPSVQTLPSFHPALSILQYLDVFGPLVFRLQQAALLRKRILFVGHAPVRAACEFVYNLSVLSSISPRDAAILHPGTDSLLRLPALFSIGVHDIPWLEELQSPKARGGHTPGNGPDVEGWVACTTDEIIATKQKLYDIVVEMPQTYETAPQKRKWPMIRSSDGTQIRASQRDVRRYKMLHRELWKIRHRNRMAEFHDNPDEDDDRAALISRDEVDAKRADDEFNESYNDTIAEPITWSHLAYLGFMWWASAGETDAYTTAEREMDRSLLGDLSDYSEGLQTAVIAYFHRSTALLIQTLSGMVERADDEEEENERGDEDEILVDRDAISLLGLDTWSEADKAFVQEFVWMYFGRQVEIRGSEVDCCGLRVPVF